MGSTATGLIGFAGWFALLSIALGVYRVGLVLRGGKAANSFATSGADLAPFANLETSTATGCGLGPELAGLLLAISLVSRARRSPARGRRP